MSKHITYSVNWQTHGFKKEDLSDDKWEILTNEFLELRSQFVRFVNGPKGYEQFNKDFDILYPEIDYVGDQNVDGYIYGSFLAWRINDAIRAKMRKDPKFMKSDLLEPYVFMDGSITDMGARLKHFGNGNCTIDLTLEAG